MSLRGLRLPDDIILISTGGRAGRRHDAAIVARLMPRSAGRTTASASQRGSGKLGPLARCYR